jgi:hypothetical protein
MDRLPLALSVDVDEGLWLECEATSDGANKQCRERWQIIGSDPIEHWMQLESAVNHAFTHMPDWSHTRL